MIEVKNLKKAYRPKKGEPVQALKGIDLQFEEKGLVFILGKSGSGKSTLLNMLGGLDQFDEGEIVIKGKSSKDFGQSDFDSYRNTFVGFIFQEYNILNDFTVGANIALAMELQGKKATKENLNEILREVGLEGFADRKPNELSGGQKQRVAIARALIKNPEIIMADEPTGALDSNTGKQVFDTLKRLSKEKLVIVVSHDREFAELYGDRVIELRDGAIISDISKYKADAAAVNEGIQIIDEKIIHIKSGYELTTEDMKMINDYLKKNKENDSFISLDGRTNEKIRQAAKIDEEGNQEVFKDTASEELAIQSYDGSHLTLIKSKLPHKSSLKMAAGSLKKKPFRLAMTILLSMVAFMLFGLANTMSSYNKTEAEANSILDSNVDYIAFEKQQEVKEDNYSYYVDKLFSDEDLQKVREQYKDKQFTPVVEPDGCGIDFSNNLYDTEKLSPNTEYPYYIGSFQGVAVLSEEVVDEMGYTLTGSLPKNDNEIVITKVAADSFIEAGYAKDTSASKEEAIASAKDMIGKTLFLTALTGREYTVVGILDTNFDGSRYDVFKKEAQASESGMQSYMLMTELNLVLGKSYHSLLYTTEGVFQEVRDSNVGISAWTPECSVEISTEETYYDISKVAEFGELSSKSKENIVFAEQGKESLGENEVIVSASSLLENMDTNAFSFLAKADSVEEAKKLMQEHKEEVLNETMKLSVSGGISGGNYTESDVTVAGIYYDLEAPCGMVIVADGFYAENDIDISGDYAFVLGKMPQDREGVLDLIRFGNDTGTDGIQYALRNSTTALLDDVDGIVGSAKVAFLYIGIAFAVFSGLMLMNFITTSISYRKREIGILRAVGARGRDVFVIFFEESLIIAMINWALAVVAAAAAITGLNTFIRTEYNMVITVFHFGMAQILLMLLLSIAVALVASFFPVYRVSKKKPIEVIRKN